MTRKIIIIILYGMVILGGMFSALSYYHRTNEDAWISFNYARNLADGHGLVSYPGGETQEGYSNFLLVLLLAVLKLALNSNIVHSAKIIGVVSFIAIIFITPFMVRLLLSALKTDSKPLVHPEYFYVHSMSWGVAASIGLSQYMGWWSTQGLETILYALSVWLLVYLTLKIVLTQQYRHLLLLTVLAFISANIRPEGLMNYPVAMGLIGLSALIDKAVHRPLVQAFFTSIGLYLLLVLLVVGFKWCYFGDIVANPTYVKLALSLTHKPYDYLTRYFFIKGWAFTLVAALALVAALGWILMRFKSAVVKTILVLLGFLASQVFFIFYSGGDYMPYHRFLITHYPLLILFIAWLALLSFIRLPQRIGLTLGFIVSVILLYSAVQEPPHIPRWYEEGFVSPRTIHQAHQTGYHLNTQRLNQLMANEPGYYATSEFGYIPYHVAAKGLDMIGLNQKQIARNFKRYPLTEVFYANRDFILSRQPKHIVVPRAYHIQADNIIIDPAIDWFFRSYLESRFFKQNYDSRVVTVSQEQWIYSDWNHNFTETTQIQVGEEQHYDKLMHGFYIEPEQIWAAPLARVLLTRTTEDKFLTLQGYIADIAHYDQQKNRIEIGFNDTAVGDYLFAQHTIRDSGPFQFKVLMDDARFPSGTGLITLRADLKKPTNGDNRALSYIFQSIYFSQD